MIKDVSKDETKSKLLNRNKITSYTVTSTISSSLGIQHNVSSITPYDIFNFCIARAVNLLKIHKAAHGKRLKPEKYLSDAHRATIVLAVSALDAFIRTFIVTRIRDIISDKSKKLPNELIEKIKKFIDQDSLIDAARKDDLLDRVEKAFINDFEKRSFQGTKAIEDIMNLIGVNNVFHMVAINAKMNEDQIKNDLNMYTDRRHLIAHRGDYQLNQQPPVENIITKKDAENCIKLVKVIAKNINALENN